MGLSMIECLDALLTLSSDNKNQCSFPPSLLIYNEGWLLRTILHEWAASRKPCGFSFSCRNEFAMFSEAQLRTPFNKKPLRETNTHVDGLVGDFIMRKNTKSGISIKKRFDFLAVFEAKMYSGIGKRITNIKDYSQISRTIACMINEMIVLGESPKCQKIHYVLLYPADSKKIINPEKNYGVEYIKSKISERFKDYYTKHNNLCALETFKDNWEEYFKLIKIEFRTWDEIIRHFNDDRLLAFYENCKKYSKNKK